MKKAMKYLSMAALAFVGALTTSCSNDDFAIEPQQPANNNIVSLTTTVGFDDSTATKRALALDEVNKKGIKTFVAGEKVAIVYTNTSDTKVTAEYTLQAEDISTDSKSTKLNFTLTDPKDGSSDVTIVYPASLADASAADGISMSRLQNNQDGTFDKLSSDFDAATATNQMTVTSGTATLPEVIALTNPLTIAKFTLKEGSSSINNTLTRVSVCDGTNTYMVNRTASADAIYLAMKPIASDQTITISATDGTDGYEKSVSGKSLDANKIYPINVTMTKTFDAKSTPLTIEAMTAGAVVCFHLSGDGGNRQVQYSTDGTNWTTYGENGQWDITLANVGDKVMFRGIGEPYNQSEITCTKDCYVYGNVMSLVTDYSANANAFATNTALTTANTFYNLFINNSHIKNHAFKSLVLPATTLAANCYSGMFSGCTGLTTAPELPPTTLAAYCYRDMFQGCTGLTTAPELPATTLVENCYHNMFYGCTGLTTAPELPAGKNGIGSLNDGCYSGMFYGCTGLTTAPELPATTLAANCYHGMFSGCTGLTTAPVLPATTLANSCYYYMFSGCTGLTTAPELPANTLVNSCYNYMFYRCSNLNSVVCLATTNIAQYNCGNWLNGVAVTGTFTKAPGATWGRGVSGIPSDWTVRDLQAMPLTFEAKVANSNIRLTINGDASVTSIEYSTDGGSSWQPYTSATYITLANVGDKVQFRGTATTYNMSNFSSNSGELYAYGNVMSLLYGSDFANKTAFPNGSQYTFSHLFNSMRNLYNHPALTIVLPATTLAAYCYWGMFYGCTGLTTAPVLPATTLVNSCYYDMFHGCSNLNSVVCLATYIPANTCLWKWLVDAGTNATSPTLHVKSSMAPSYWNAPGWWTIVVDN